MNWINLNIKKISRILIVTLLPFVAINVQQKPTSNDWFNKPFSFLASLSQQGFHQFSTLIKGTTAVYINLVNLRRDAERIQSENKELRARLQEMVELTKENNRLNELLDFRSKTTMQLVAAQVMSQDLVTDHNTLQINKGTHHGLVAGQAVITVDGVVGYIFRPSAFTAKILLITDRYAVVDGVVSRTRVRGIVQGRGNQGLSLEAVEKSEDVQKGDLIVTSNLDHIFPKGFPVAYVKSVESRSYAVSLKVELRPAVDPSRIEEVFVILKDSPENFEEILKKQDMIEEQNEKNEKNDKNEKNAKDEKTKE